MYDLVIRNVNPVLYQAVYAEQLIHRYRQDADKWLEEVHISTDGLVWNRAASYYYDPHSLSRQSGKPLARIGLCAKKMSGGHF